MTFAELVLIGRPVDYTHVDSRAILREFAAAKEELLYVRLALEYELSLLDKEFAVSLLAEDELERFIALCQEPLKTQSTTDAVSAKAGEASL